MPQLVSELSQVNTALKRRILKISMMYGEEYVSMALYKDVSLRWQSFDRMDCYFLFLKCRRVAKVRKLWRRGSLTALLSCCFC